MYRGKREEEKKEEEEKEEEKKMIITIFSCSLIFVAGTRPISHRVGRSVGRPVGPSHFAFFLRFWAF